MTGFLIKLLIAIILTAGGLVIHVWVQAVPSSPIVVDNGLERSIPFWPHAIWVYFSFFAFIAYTVFKVDDIRFWRFVLASVMAASLAWVIVIAFPVTAPRPDPQLIDNALYRQIFTFVHTADPHHISFPSLHVAVTWICCLLLWPLPYRTWRVLLAVAISLSTLLTKQHIVPDVVGGVILALICVHVTGRTAHRLPRSPLLR